MKRIIITLLTACMAMALGINASAASYSHSGSVSFDGTELSEGYVSGLQEITGEIQPGDSAEIVVKLENNGKTDTDWYMNNSVLSGFEKDTKASGGAYSYELTIDGEEIFSSKTVGGEGSTGGLEEITALENDVYIKTLKAGDSAVVRLIIGLDGETITNNYQNTNASLDLGFSVTETAKPKTIYRTEKVYTGDSNNMWIYQTLAVVAVTAVLAVLICAKYDKKEAE